MSETNRWLIAVDRYSVLVIVPARHLQPCGHNENGTPPRAFHNREPNAGMCLFDWRSRRRFRPRGHPGKSSFEIRATIIDGSRWRNNGRDVSDAAKTGKPRPIRVYRGNLLCDGLGRNLWNDRSVPVSERTVSLEFGADSGDRCPSDLSQSRRAIPCCKRQRMAVVAPTAFRENGRTERRQKTRVDVFRDPFRGESEVILASHPSHGVGFS